MQNELLHHWIKCLCRVIKLLAVVLKDVNQDWAVSRRGKFEKTEQLGCRVRICMPHTFTMFRRKTRTLPPSPNSCDFRAPTVFWIQRLFASSVPLPVISQTINLLALLLIVSNSLLCTWAQAYKSGTNSYFALQLLLQLIHCGVYGMPSRYTAARNASPNKFSRTPFQLTYFSKFPVLRLLLGHPA